MRKEILKNIEHDLLREQPEVDLDDPDEIVEILVETACASIFRLLNRTGYPVGTSMPSTFILP